MELDILYCDNHLLVVNKPSGLLTQPNESSDPSLQGLAKQWLKEKYYKPGNCFLETLHRLDRPVSGVVLFARTSKALSRLNEQLRKGAFEKHYLAVVEGLLENDSDTLEHYLKRDSHSTRTYSTPHHGSKKSILKYQVLNRSHDCTHLAVKLITGRYHQIRAQLAALGHPILGDSKYGSKIASTAFFLHHYELSFPHPITNETLHITASLPPQWSKFT